jgi:uncharacterized protein
VGATVCYFPGWVGVRDGTAPSFARAPPRARAAAEWFAMGAGYVGILSVELHFPEAGSLKGKRKFLRSAKAQLQNRFGAAVAEVDHHELWQRSRLTVACVAREAREAERLLDEAERYLNGQEWEVGPRTRDLVTLDE